MKKAMLLAVVIAIVITTGGISVYRYNQYQNKQTQLRQAEQSAEDARLKEASAITATRDKTVASYNSLRIECEKGKAAYDALTPVQKTATKVQSPFCGAVLVK